MAHEKSNKNLNELVNEQAALIEAQRRALAEQDDRLSKLELRPAPAPATVIYEKEPSKPKNPPYHSTSLVGAELSKAVAAIVSKHGGSVIVNVGKTFKDVAKGGKTERVVDATKATFEPLGAKHIMAVYKHNETGATHAVLVDGRKVDLDGGLRTEGRR